MTGAHPGPRHRFELLLAIVLVGAIVAAVHWPVLGAQALSLDDSDYLTYNPLVTHPGWTSGGRFFGEVLKPSTFKGYYHPLSMTSLMLEYATGGRPDDLRVFHQTSLALHVLNAGLIVLILYRLFGALIPAGLAGLMFGLHPLTVEPTAWIGEQKTLLAAVFALACLLCYLQRGRGRGRAWSVASLALYVLALLSKPTVTMLPLLLLALDAWPLGRLSVRTVVEKWPYLLLSLVSGVITLLSQHHVGGIGSTTTADYLRWPLRVCYVLAFYLRKIVWPTNLSCVYPQPEPLSLANPAVLLSVVGVCLLTILLALSLRRTRGPLIGALFFGLALAPTLGLVNYTWVIAFDNYVYLPALGLLLLLAFGLTLAWNSRRLGGAGPKAVLLLLILPILAAEARGVRATQRHWTNSLTLYRHMESIAPHSPVVHNKLGILLEGQSAHDEAILHLRRALALEPDYGDAHYNLGIVLASRGQIGESIRHFHRAVELLPDYPEAVYNLGMSLRLANDLDEAAAQFRRALILKPDYVEALDQLGGVLVLRGRTGEAIEQFEKALAISPKDALLHFRLSMALLMAGGRSAEAVNHLRDALRDAPNWPDPFNALAWLFATSPDPTVRSPAEAVQLAGRAVELSASRDPKVLDTLAAAQAATGEFEKAAQTARTAIDLASRSHSVALVDDIRSRMALYERGSAYTEAATTGKSP